MKENNADFDKSDVDFENENAELIGEVESDADSDEDYAQHDTFLQELSKTLKGTSDTALSINNELVDLADLTEEHEDYIEKHQLTEEEIGEDLQLEQEQEQEQEQEESQKTVQDLNSSSKSGHVVVMDENDENTPEVNIKAKRKSKFDETEQTAEEIERLRNEAKLRASPGYRAGYAAHVESLRRKIMQKRESIRKKEDALLDFTTKRYALEQENLIKFLYDPHFIGSSKAKRLPKQTLDLLETVHAFDERIEAILDRKNKLEATVRAAEEKTKRRRNR